MLWAWLMEFIGGSHRSPKICLKTEKPKSGPSYLKPNIEYVGLLFSCLQHSFGLLVLGWMSVRVIGVGLRYSGYSSSTDRLGGPKDREGNAL